MVDKIMRKIQLLGMVLVAMFAFSAFISSSAFAAEFELAQWLVGSPGAKITAALASDTLGELTLLNDENGGGMLCSGLFEGTVGPESADEITMVYNLAGTLIEELDGTTAAGGVSCVESKETCETGSEVWPVNLPWKTELELNTVTGTYWDLVVPNGNGLTPAYFILCLALSGLVNVEELCEALIGSGGELLNVTGGVEPFGEALPLGNCSSHTGVTVLLADPGGLITLTSGEALTVSE